MPKIGRPRKPENKKCFVIGLSVPFEMAQRFDAACVEKGLTRTELGRQVLTAWLDANGYTPAWWDAQKEENELY